MPPEASSLPTFTPVKQARAFELICDRIRQELAAGRLQPGDRLPPERELAVQFGVSRTALREALRSLEVGGIIRNAKGARGGAFIQTGNPERINQALHDYIQLSDISIEELTEVRILLQDIIVRLACERASEADLDKLEAIARETGETEVVEGRYTLAVAFYATLAESTGNRLFGLFINALSAIFHDLVHGPDYKTLQQGLIRSRLRLVRLLRSRDADGAAEEMRRHLERLHSHVLRHRPASR